MLEFSAMSRIYRTTHCIPLACLTRNGSDIALFKNFDFRMLRRRSFSDLRKNHRLLTGRSLQIYPENPLEMAVQFLRFRGVECSAHQDYLAVVKTTDHDTNGIEEELTSILARLGLRCHLESDFRMFHPEYNAKKEVVM